MRLCVAVTDVAMQTADALEPLVSAVTYKRYRPTGRFAQAAVFMDTPLNIVLDDLAPGLEALGFWKLRGERQVEGLAFDLGPATDAYGITSSPNGYPRAQVQGRRLSEPEYLERARRNIAWVRSLGMVHVRLENLNYFPTPDDAYAQVCEPGFISRVLDAVGAEMILDIGHAVISSANLGIALEAYLLDLPLHRVSEVHLSAANVIQGIWEDVHGPPGPREWALLDWLCARSPVRYVTIEYYQDPAVLVESYQTLAARVASWGR